MISQIQIKADPNSHKIGINEVVGLKDAMTNLMLPVQALIKDKVYWNDCELVVSEYKSRDGFIPYSHNCGGLDLTVVIPKCEEYEFKFLEFGECEECSKSSDQQCGFEGMECSSEGGGHLDAKLRIWFKFEGINDEGALEFYLYAGGGNGDAPYFRTKAETTVFEASFSCKSIAGLKRASAKHFKALMKAMGAK